MSVLDPELLKDFVEEMKTLEAEQKAVVEALRPNVEQPPMFEKFAQVIDRIYGTAATFGFAELAAYCGMLKKTCYETAKSNKRAQVKVFSMLEVCIQNLDELIKGVHNPEIMKKLKHTLHIETQKAKKLQDEYFKFNTKAA